MILRLMKHKLQDKVKINTDFYIHHYFLLSMNFLLIFFLLDNCGSFVELIKFICFDPPRV